MRTNRYIKKRNIESKIATPLQLDVHELIMADQKVDHLWKYTERNPFYTLANARLLSLDACSHEKGVFLLPLKNLRQKN